MATVSSASRDSAASAGPVRYRCAACGNLTRFDVTTTRRTRAYHHYSLSGDLSVEEHEVLTEVVEDVSCRWCGSGKAVAVLPLTVPASASAEPAPAGEPGPAADSGPPPERSGA